MFSRTTSQPLIKTTFNRRTRKPTKDTKYVLPPRDLPLCRLVAFLQCPLFRFQYLHGCIIHSIHNILHLLHGFQWYVFDEEASKACRTEGKQRGWTEVYGEELEHHRTVYSKRKILVMSWV